MRILVIGRGGREHAILSKVLQSNLVTKAYVAPGNGATGIIASNIEIDETDIPSLVDFAKYQNIDLTIVGPENALEAGIVDAFNAANLTIFGPSKAACMLESSKVFAKEIMNKYQIATADYARFNDYTKALAYAQHISYPQVIKYDGLAAGKGVVICQSYEEMSEQLDLMLKQQIYGTADVIIEEFLEGEEFTLLSLVKDDKVHPLEISRDFKRAFVGDTGPNTGGMGAICPYDKISSEQKQEAINILKQTAKAMVQEGTPFAGVLYGGFIATPNGVKVIEYNARFGDPETEVVLQKLNNDLVKLILDVLANKDVIIENDTKTYVGICLASKGYPQSYEKGYVITGHLEQPGIYHMGTKYRNSKFTTNGGRVLFVSASGDNLEQARQRAYTKVADIECSNLFYREDIGR